MNVKVALYLFHVILIVGAVVHFDDEDETASGSGSNPVFDGRVTVELTTTPNARSIDNTDNTDNIDNTTPTENSGPGKAGEKGVVRFLTVGIAVGVMSVVILAVLAVVLVKVIRRKKQRKQKLAALNQHSRDPQCTVISNQMKIDQQDGRRAAAAEANVYAECK